MSEAHVVWHDHAVTRENREALNRHRGCVVWFTGLSGSGKSTIANRLDRLLFEQGIHSYLLDGDNIRHGLNASPAKLSPIHGDEFAQRFGLGFGPQDREENIRRIGAVAQLFAAAGIVTLTAFVSPYRRDRDFVRAQMSQAGRPEDFIEVLVNAPLEVCESRDPKGLYRMARAGQIKDFTGIHDPYEPPEHPELVLDSANNSIEFLVNEVWSYLRTRVQLP